MTDINLPYMLPPFQDPAPLLFYLITDAYKAGSAKEMRK